MSNGTLGPAMGLMSLRTSLIVLYFRLTLFPPRVVYIPNTKGGQENVLMFHWSEYLLLEIIQILLSESVIISLLQSTPCPLSSPGKSVAYPVPT